MQQVLDALTGAAAHIGNDDRDLTDLELNYERLEVVFDTGLTIFTYTADPGTRSAEALGLLASLAATGAAERTSPAP